MLTRLEVNGFKNLVNFSLDFGPCTCIAGPNGIGKSNIFDAIRFLSLLTHCTINQAALQIRNAGEDSGDIADLFFAAEGGRAARLEFAAEMIVERDVSDDFGRRVETSSSFLRYEVAFRHDPPSTTSGALGGLVLEREELRPIITGRAARHLKFPHNKRKFRDSVVYNNRHSRSPYISTLTDSDSQRTSVVVHQDGGSHARGRPAPADGATRTIIGTENTSATPTILAARREMQNWRILALEPSAMRRPDRYTQTPGIAANGAHMPATLQHLANIASDHDDESQDVFAIVTNRLSDLIPVSAIRVVRDDVRQLLSLELEEPSGLKLRANSISDGTLRFLALAVLAVGYDESGVFCMEEPENGVHPANLAAIIQLLHDIAVDPNEPVSIENPLRQIVLATHSPYFVQLQNHADLVLAKNDRVHSESGALVHHLRCYPYADSWRSAADSGEVIDLIALQSYLTPPDGAQTAFPREFWAPV